MSANAFLENVGLGSPVGKGMGAVARFSATILLLASGCIRVQTPSTVESEPMFRIVEKGSYGRAASEPDSPSRTAILIAKDAATFRDLWAALIGSSPEPRIDFTKETAVFLMLGRRSTGGYAVNPESVTVENSTATVRATLTQPARGGIVTMAFTAPYGLIAVENREFDRAEWVDAQGVLVARSE